jgi:hypothetical protein
MIATPGGTLNEQSFTSKTADETLGPWHDVRGRANVVFYITGSGVTSSGVVTFEEAAPKDVSVVPNRVAGCDTGKYTSITTVNASDVDGDKQKAVHLTPQAYCYVRARISTVVGGGGDLSVCCIAY